MVAGGPGGGGRRVTARGSGFLLGDENVLTLIVVMLLDSTNTLKSTELCAEISELCGKGMTSQ